MLAEEVTGIIWENAGEVWAKGAARELEGRVRFRRKVWGRGVAVSGALSGRCWYPLELGLVLVEPWLENHS